MTALEFHPVANIFPLVEGADFAELVADIRKHGLHERIVLYADKILDGRNRYRACYAAGVEPIFTVYEGDDPVAYVVSLNLRRRHLSESQRAMVAAKLATLGHGGDRSKSPIGDLKQADAAELLNVGKRSVERAREVQEHGAPELIEAVEHGKISVSAAADVAALPALEQREILARGEREILRAAQEIRARKAEMRRAERIERLAVTCNQNSLFPSERRYAVIYADPPWQFRVYDENSSLASEHGAAGVHYPCMPTDAICALPVKELATDAAALFLWTTAPHLPEALQAVAAWGFTYKTHAVWIKDWIGLGYFVRNQHELLLIATRGDMPSPAPANRSSSVITAPRREHSQKPDEAYMLIEQMYPELPKVELFARQTRTGWAAWGNEVITAA
jgi:N6-adenosine-specific RNA methylase IME4/ParB-like chromosome segregation protein Spo0J